MMFRRPRLRRRTRPYLTWLALLALLFQQVALAIYVCPAETTPAEPAAMAGCAGMDAFDAEAPLLCRQHCERDHVAPADAKALHVPPIALPPQHFAWTAALLPPARAQHYEDIPPCRSDPPPAQRFCSLQI